MTFMERSLADRLVPARDSGVAASNTFLDQRLWFGIGGFYDSDGTGDSTDDKWNMSTRMAGTVWKSDDAHLLHVGGNYRYSDLNNLTGVRRAARPEANQGNRYIDTRVEGAGGDPGDSSDDIDKLCGGTSFSPGGGSCRYSHSFGAELAGVYGPFSIQGEWIGTYFDQKDVKNPFLTGWYLFGSWFIMGGGTAPTTRSQRSSAGRGRRTIFSMTEARARSSWPFATRPFGSTARWRAAATSVT